MSTTLQSECPPSPADIAALLLAGVDRGGTIGVSFLGVIFSAMVYGVTCIQTFQYYRTAKSASDSTFLRSMVFVLWMLDSLHQGFIIHIIYHVLITNFGNPVAIAENLWSISAQIIANAIIAFFVDTFFVLRVYKLSRNRIVTGILLVFTVAHLSTNLIFPIRGFFFKYIQQAETTLKSTGTAGLAVAVLTDVSISMTLAWYLNQSKTGLRRSDDMVEKLIVMTITTGMLTTVFVIATMVAYLAAPNKLYLMFFYFMLGKMYINAFLTSLNSREYVWGKPGKPAMVNSVPLAVFHSDATQSQDLAIGASTDSGTLTAVSEQKSICVV